MPGELGNQYAFQTKQNKAKPKRLSMCQKCVEFDSFIIATTHRETNHQLCDTHSPSFNPLCFPSSSSFRLINSNGDSVHRKSNFDDMERVCEFFIYCMCRYRLNITLIMAFFVVVAHSRFFSN